MPSIANFSLELNGVAKERLSHCANSSGRCLLFIILYLAKKFC